MPGQSGTEKFSAAARSVSGSEPVAEEAKRELEVSGAYWPADHELDVGGAQRLTDPVTLAPGNETVRW